MFYHQNVWVKVESPIFGKLSKEPGRSGNYLDEKLKARKKDITKSVHVPHNIILTINTVMQQLF